jgi:uncharacterized protein involved in propanediol utilization
MSQPSDPAAWSFAWSRNRWDDVVFVATSPTGVTVTHSGTVAGIRARLLSDKSVAAMREHYGDEAVEAMRAAVESEPEEERP